MSYSWSQRRLFTERVTVVFSSCSFSLSATHHFHCPPYWFPPRPAATVEVFDLLVTLSEAGAAALSAAPARGMKSKQSEDGPSIMYVWEKAFACKTIQPDRKMGLNTFTVVYIFIFIYIYKKTTKNDEQVECCVGVDSLLLPLFFHLVDDFKWY